MVLKETVWIFAIAAVGRPTRRLNISDAVRIRTEHPKIRFRMHRSRPDLDIVGLLDDAASITPVRLKLKDEVLERRPFVNLFL